MLTYKVSLTLGGVQYSSKLDLKKLKESYKKAN